MQTLDAIDNNDKSFFVIRGTGFQTLMKLSIEWGKGAKSIVSDYSRMIGTTLRSHLK